MKIHCNGCQIVTNHLVLGQAEGKYEWNGPSVYFRQRYYILQCKGCDAMSFLLEEDDKLTDLGDRASVSQPFDSGENKPLIHPPRVFRRLPAWFNSMPRSEVMSLLHEVYAALQNDSRRLAAMGVRTILDLVVTKEVGDADEKGNFKTFKKKLAEYVKLTGVGVRTQDAIKRVNKLGDAAIHGGFHPEPSQIIDAIDAMEHILHEAYILPRGTQRLEDTTPERSPRPKGSL